MRVATRSPGWTPSARRAPPMRAALRLTSPAVEGLADDVQIGVVGRRLDPGPQQVEDGVLLVADPGGRRGHDDASSSAKRSTRASSTCWAVPAPPGTGGSRTSPLLAAGQQDRGVARGGRLAPLVLAPQVEVDGRLAPVGQVAPGDAAPHPVGVADVVEAAELAVQLPEPGVVAHPVGAGVDQPRLPHPAVVVDGGAARPPGPLGVPVHALLDVGDVEVVGPEEPGHLPALLLAEAQRLHPVEAHAHAHVPTDDVGDPERALHQGLELVALGHLLPPAGLGPPAPVALGQDGLGDALDLLVGVRADLGVVVLARRLRLLPLAPDHQPVLGGQGRTVLLAEDLRRPLVDGPSRELARLVVDADEGVATGDPGPGVQRLPPLAVAPGIERMDPAQRVALHQGLGLVVVAGDLVLADQGVAADQVRRGDRPRPSGWWRRRRGRTRAGCRRRRTRPRGGRRPRWASGSAGAGDGVGGPRCGPAGRRSPRR